MVMIRVNIEEVPEANMEKFFRGLNKETQLGVRGLGVHMAIEEMVHMTMELEDMVHMGIKDQEVFQTQRKGHVTRHPYL